MTHFRAIYVTTVFQSYIPSPFSVENVFVYPYLFLRLFDRALSYHYSGVPFHCPFVVQYLGRCPAKSPFWSFNFITIKIVRYAKQHIFTTVLYFLFKFRTLVHTSVLSVQTDFGALDIFRAMVTKVSNPMG